MIRLEDKYSDDEILHAAANILCGNELSFKQINGYASYYYYSEIRLYVIKLENSPYPPYFAFVLADSPEEALKKIEDLL